MRDGRLASDVLHDVDLAAPWPTHRIDVRTEHPEGGPESLSARDTDPGLEATVRLCEQSSGLEPGRRVPAPSVPALVRGRRRLGPCSDHEVARAVQLDVVAAGRVELPLLVAEAGTAGVCDPPGAVEGRPRRSGELVVPDGTRRGHGIGPRDDRKERDEGRSSRGPMPCP